jgi:hypothetical protein
VDKKNESNKELKKIQQSNFKMRDEKQCQIREETENSSQTYLSFSS